MAIERKNSFHLLLSDDELKLLKILADRDGLNASDYIRTLLRREAREAGGGRHAAAFGGLGRRDDLRKVLRVARATASAARKTPTK